jgi:hypothetical protein
LSATIGALPGDAVAAHTPHIFIHTDLAYAEPASALPTEVKFLPAAVALLILFSAATSLPTLGWCAGHRI